MTSIRIQSNGQTLTGDSAAGGRVFRIGRDTASDLVGMDPTISRRHAEIRPTPEGWEVVDLGSSVGTWVDGRRVERADLSGTTVIGFGRDGKALTATVTVTPDLAKPAAPAPPAAPGPAVPPTQAVGQYGAPGSPPPPQFGAGPQPGPQPGQAPPPSQYGDRPPLGGPHVPGGTPFLEQTMVVPGAGGGFPGFGPSGPGLLIRRRTGGDLRFPAGLPVRIGRDPALEVHADDQAVSRLHAVLEPRPDGWWWVDRSTSGSYIDGERLTQRKIEEPAEISLGHPTAGYEIEVVPVVAAGQASRRIQARKRRRTLAIIGGIAAALVLIGGGITAVALLDGNGDSDVDGDPTVAGPTDPGESRDAALNRAKAAAVLLTAYDENDQPLWSGSGSLISEDGQILTNAHVGDPDAPGQSNPSPDPAYLTVSLTSEQDDLPAAAAYRAKPIVSDGYLDVAVLQIEADAEGNPVDKADLDLPEPLPLGNSDDVRTGDRIIALGYPAIGNVIAHGDRPLTVTEGVVSTFQADPVVGTSRGAIDSDVRLGSGNSGGPSINEEGEIIGLNTRVVTADSMDAGAITGGSALIVPVNLAKAVLDIAKSGGDPDYVSPYVDELPDPTLPADGNVVAAGWVREGEQGNCKGTSSPEAPQRLSGVTTGSTIVAEFGAESLPDGAAVSVEFYDADGLRLDSLSTTWDRGPAPVCIQVGFTVPYELPGLNAVLFVGSGGEPAAENPVLLSAG
ncbi:FHA domain-containing protein [Nocardioides sp. GXZ039]|uniref:FHA domain-containing protein n=1 Tax=Nocardioides sp. GXZ039 TaxID=3136018 RepID=UPI0030F3AA7B